MKRVWLLSVLISFIIWSNPNFAQKTIFYENIDDQIAIGRELFYQKRYNASFYQFDLITKSVDPSSSQWVEAEYYKSTSALKAGHTAGVQMVERFIKEYPSSPYQIQAYIALGNHRFDKKQYGAMLRSYETVDLSRLPEEDQIMIKYQKGYGYLMIDDIEKALNEFYEIKDLNSIYSRSATYYYAHIMYLQNNYQAALDEMRKLESDPAYSQVIPMYVSQIYYKQDRFSDVISYTEPILDAVTPENRKELTKILGDSYFHLHQYEKALNYLEQYFEGAELKSREENYLIGYSYYHTGATDRAIPFLESVTKGRDELAQNACYHLADCYLKQGKKESARIAFEAASEFEFNERIREDALFNFAKLTYELSYSPFNETINAFDKYISLYPNSERNSEAYRYLTDVFMVTRNYQDALNSIEKITVKTPDIKRAYQRVALYRGLELFNNMAYSRSIDYFNLSQENDSYNSEYNAQAQFWKAEAYYRLGDYRQSVEAYTQFLRNSGAFAISEFEVAEYNLAYAYFKMEDYRPASNHFQNYIYANKNQRSRELADAYNRLGDYYFYITEYELARQNYLHAFNLDLFEPDYSLYQIAFCRGLMHDQQGKIETLKQLQNRFPDSDYFDDALFELGRAYERTSGGEEATAYYQQIIHNFPESIYYPRSLLQLGLIKYNSGDFIGALSSYKQVTERFPGTAEAQAALLGIRNCYVEMNNVDGYLEYTQSLGRDVIVTKSEQDSLLFSAAEKLYMSGSDKANRQLTEYLEKFPQGSFSINAAFYLAELQYKEGNYTEAMINYSNVADQPNNIFSEQALSRASELQFNSENYERALSYFERLGNIAGNKWNVLKASSGAMRCLFILERYDEAIASAEKVKISEVANDAWIREANFILGKSYLLINDPNRAIDYLKSVASDTKLEQGAEAKFLVAEIYYGKGEKEEAEKEIMDFINMGTPYQYWLGKTFLLLAEIYIDRNDDFQARHTLRSLIENYNVKNDGIVDEATKKLASIEAEDISKEQQIKEGSFQLKIDNN